MKIGVRPHDLQFETISEMCEICKENQIDGLQLVFMKLFPDQITDEEFIDNVIDEIRSNNINIYLLGSYFNMIHPEKEKLIQGYDTFEINTRIANRNNIDYIGSETGSVNGDAWTYHPDNHTETSYMKLEESINIITSNIKDAKYLLEPVYDHVSHNLQLTERMMLNEHVAITFDLANVLNTENYQDYLKIFESYLQTFGNRIKIFHFKNFIIKDDAKVGCRLDQGLLDYTKIYSIVEEYNLTDVPIIVEELQGEDLFASIKFIKSLA